MLKLIVCDWDGTVADSVNKIVKCKGFLAEKYNLTPPSEDTVKAVLGTKFEDALAKCFPTVTKETLNEIGEEFHILMQQEAYQATLFPNAVEVLKSFKNRGIKLAVATSKDKKELDKALLHNRVSDLFDLVCCGKEYQEKPHPAMLEHMLKTFGVEPDECVMIGDTTTDIRFANNADVKTIAVTFGAHSVSQLEVLNPYALMTQWKQLPKLMQELCYTPTYSPS